MSRGHRHRYLLALTAGTVLGKQKDVATDVDCQIGVYKRKNLWNDLVSDARGLHAASRCVSCQACRAAVAARAYTCRVQR